MSGLASGINWTSIVNEMLTVEAAPETQMNTEETADKNKNTAYQTIGTDLTTLNTDVKTLRNPGFFASRTTTVSNSSVASATAASGTALGSYTFDVTHTGQRFSAGGIHCQRPTKPHQRCLQPGLEQRRFRHPRHRGHYYGQRPDHHDFHQRYFAIRF